MFASKREWRNPHDLPGFQSDSVGRVKFKVVSSGFGFIWKKFGNLESSKNALVQVSRSLPDGRSDPIFAYQFQANRIQRTNTNEH